VAYVRGQMAERLRNFKGEVEAEIATRRERLTDAEARVKVLVEFVATGHKGKNVGA
jgi:hypothetical protein